MGKYPTYGNVEGELAKYLPLHLRNGKHRTDLIGNNEDAKVSTIRKTNAAHLQKIKYKPVGKVFCLKTPWWGMDDDKRVMAFKRTGVEIEMHDLFEDNPHVPRLYAFGGIGSCPSFVNEFVEGETLFTKIRYGLGIMDGLKICQEYARAVAGVHNKGVVLRDIKPENVIVTPEGEVRLVDFGLALNGVDRITKYRCVVGTPAYMPPEIASGDEKGDVCSDMYSMGCSLYHALTHKTPFEGSPRDVMFKHIYDIPKNPSERNAEISSALNDLILRTMSKSRDARPESMDELVEEIKRVRASYE